MPGSEEEPKEIVPPEDKKDPPLPVDPFAFMGKIYGDVVKPPEPDEPQNKEQP